MENSEVSSPPTPTLPPVQEKRRWTKRKILGLLLIVAVAVAGVAYAATTLTIKVPVTVSVASPPLAMTQVSVIQTNPTGLFACTISSDALTATCPNVSISTPSTTTEVFVSVKNSTPGALPVTVSASSDNTAVATVTASVLNPSSVGAGTTTGFYFDINGIGTGTANISVTITG